LAITASRWRWRGVDTIRTQDQHELAELLFGPTDDSPRNGREPDGGESAPGGGQSPPGLAAPRCTLRDREAR
jgi:hypothetical protein